MQIVDASQFADLPPSRKRRPLTDGERFVFSEIQAMYGLDNTEDEVFFPSEDEAVIFARNSSGQYPIMVVFTTLAKSYADGSIEFTDELRRALSLPGGNQ